MFIKPTLSNDDNVRSFFISIFDGRPTPYTSNNALMDFYQMNIFVC